MQGWYKWPQLFIDIYLVYTLPLSPIGTLEQLTLSARPFYSDNNPVRVVAQVTQEFKDRAGIQSWASQIVVWNDITQANSFPLWEMALKQT